MDLTELKEKYPKSLQANTGEVEETYTLINSFFDDITYLIDSKKERELEPKDKRVRIHPSFKRELYYLLQPSFTKQKESLRNPERSSDKTCHILKYNNRMIATVIEIRTENNYHDFMFSEQIERILKEN